jgi:hypothetical protein
MSKRIRMSVVVCAALAGLFALATLGAAEPEPKKDAPKPEGKADAATPVKPKPLSAEVKKGLKWLVDQQHASGGWGQGGGWRTNTQAGGRVEGANVADPPDVANTALAVLALIRAGNTPREGEYAKNVAKGIDFICNHIEKADKDSLHVTSIRDTQVQVKIGPYVDTFLAALVLSEVKGKYPTEKEEKPMLVVLDKVVKKIEKNQKADGTFEGNNAWASVLSQGLASKSINRAAQNGVMVQPQVLARDKDQSVVGLDPKSGKFGTAGSGMGGFAGGLGTPGGGFGRPLAGPAATTPAPAVPSDAGVGIYNSSARVAGLQETVNTLKQREDANKKVLGDKNAPKEEKEKATKELQLLQETVKAQTVAVAGIAQQVQDQAFVAGFGNNGGEEFLSFMNISETLVAKGGKEWQDWDKKVTEMVAKVQDKDGGWSGHHCITGRTFCTSAALLTLMADRAPVPVAAKMREKSR